ncbi:hypothetical protein BOX15_Mlig018874g1, partial [Macrostomum lignano]
AYYSFIKETLPAAPSANKSYSTSNAVMSSRGISAIPMATIVAAVVCLLIATCAAVPAVEQQSRHQVERRSAGGGAGGPGEDDFYKLFMVKRMLENQHHHQHQQRLQRRGGDFDRLMNQLERLNRDNAGANADSMIFRLRKRLQESGRAQQH